MDDYQEIPQEKEEKDEEKPSLLAQFIQVTVVFWALAVISWSYFNPNPTRQIDTTFCAGLLSSVLSQVAGITTKKPGTGNGKNNTKSRKDPITGKNIGPDGKLQ
tara:strand:+ start:16178 stop:16489 length:312 start_codon:yes stop_codon:yes gene_type:complete